MGDAPRLDRRLVRRSFDQAAQSYDAAAALQREVSDRMAERLDYLKRAPAMVLDAGSGTGYGAAALRRRYPRARVVEFDLAHGMLRRSLAGTPWWRRALGVGPGRHVCGAVERMPFVAGAFDMVWSNLCLQWVEDLDAVFAECWRVLAPGGVLMFSTFGPDTLKELRSAYAVIDARPHVNVFIDMHDIGDALVRARFADPVMDMEIVTLSYGDLTTLLRELKAIGAHNVARGRTPGLTGRRSFERVCAEYERFRRDGRLPATYEVVYGQAWKPERPRVLPDGRQVIEVVRRG